MGCDPKDFLISELELQLNETRRRLATSQCLNLVLEQLSNVLEKRLESAISTNKKLRDENGRLKYRTQSAARSHVAAIEEAVAENGPVAINKIKDEAEDVEEEVFNSSPNLLTKKIVDSSTGFAARNISQTTRNRRSASKRMDISRFSSLNRKFPCPYCSLACLSRKDLERHLLGHTGDKPFQCPVAGCDVRFTRKFAINRHLQTAHDKSDARSHSVIKEEKVVDNRPIAINQVKDGEEEEVEEQVFDSLQSLNLLTTRLAESQIFVPTRTCARTVGNRRATSRRMDISRFKSLRNRKFPCPYCPLSCCSGKDLERHLLHHTGEKPFECPIEGCDARFTRKFAINSHLQSCHEKSRDFMCSQCEFSTGSRANLVRHEAAAHRDKFVRCDVQECGKEFKRSQLQPHRRKAHGLYAKGPADGAELEIRHEEFITDDDLGEGHILGNSLETE